MTNEAIYKEEIRLLENRIQHLEQRVENSNKLLDTILERLNGSITMTDLDFILEDFYTHKDCLKGAD